MLIWLEISFAERARKVPQIPLVLLISRSLLFLICLSSLFLYHSFISISQSYSYCLSSIVTYYDSADLGRTFGLAPGHAFAFIHAIAGPVLPLPFCSF